MCALFNHTELGELHGPVTCNDPGGVEPAEWHGGERAELCAQCEAADKHPGFRLSSRLSCHSSDPQKRKVERGCFGFGFIRTF